ncbi:MAG: helix-turn-helix domain-containing protein [Balneolaceae bacterium]|nr:helix-turn-helix domain-containing protein [Balneolaceae bacterium]
MPALGKDLSKIRSHLGLSIQDVQHMTKIPVSTLKSIENGAIFSHPEENQTYIRSFVRSYGRALKIDDDMMIKALDQNETGNYNHLLLQQYPSLAPQEQTEHRHEEKPEEEAERTSEGEYREDESVEEKPSESEEGSSFENEENKEVEALEKPQDPEEKPDITETVTPQEDIKPKKKETGPSVKSVDWADVGRKFTEEEKHTPVWIVIVIIVLTIAAFVAYFLYQNGFFNIGDLSQQQEQVDSENATTQSSLSLDLEDSLEVDEPGSETNIPEEAPVVLDEVLQLTIYAAYDGLGPVRIWSDMKPRMDPYWLEQGTAMEFEFTDTIRVRGSYEDMLLFKDGHRIENAAQQFLQQEQNYIELTRNFFESEEKWATTVDFELPEGVPPPDSITTRPTF